MTISVLYVPWDVSRRVEVREIRGDLRDFQELVGGLIESIFLPHASCIGDDEAKLRNDWMRRVNHRGNTLALLLGWPAAGVDLLAGDLVFCGEVSRAGRETSAPKSVLTLAGRLGLLEE